MGGRRAANLSGLVGTSKAATSAKRILTTAVSHQDPAAIAGASVRLVAASSVGLKALRYGLKLSPFISESASTLAKMGPVERSEAVRSAWSAVKSREGIRASPELDSAVVTAALSALRKRRER